MLAGAMLAALVLVPVVNLLTPLFGVALMVHVHKGSSAPRACPTGGPGAGLTAGGVARGGSCA